MGIQPQPSLFPRLQGGLFAPGVVIAQDQEHPWVVVLQTGPQICAGGGEIVRDKVLLAEARGQKVSSQEEEVRFFPGQGRQQFLIAVRSAVEIRSEEAGSHLDRGRARAGSVTASILAA